MGFSGLRRFCSRIKVFLGGYECAPKTQPFHIVNRCVQFKKKSVMRQIFIQLFFISIIFNSYSQSNELKMNRCRPVRVESGEYKDFNLYHFKDIDFYFGINSFKKMIRIIKNNTEVFALNDSISDAMTYVPTLFSNTKDSQSLILLVEIATEFSWGQLVILIEQDKAYRCGFIDYGVDMKDESSIALITRVIKHNDKFEISFKDTLLYQSSNETNKIRGNRIKYILENHKLSVLLN